MESERRLLDLDLAREVEALRLPERSSGAGLLGSLRWLCAPGGPLAREPARGDAVGVARAIATVASVDMSLAFSSWAHRMVTAYVDEADGDAFRGSWGARVQTVDVPGSTALAAAMTCHLTGAPLPIAATERGGGGLELSGSIAWASNLFRPRFLLVAAAEIPGVGRRIVAIDGETQGVEIAPFPELLDLQETASSSIRLERARVRREDVVALDFDGFVRRVRPRFLLWQASFCWGLAARSLMEAAPRIRGGVSEIFAADHQALVGDLDRIEGAIEEALVADEASREGRWPQAPSAVRDVVRIRLDAAQLSGAATRLEAKVVGGRGYVARSATARRQREAAFLPIQSPTEGQLRWELSSSS